MNRGCALIVLALAHCIGWSSNGHNICAQEFGSSQIAQFQRPMSAAAAMRPLGAPSALDAFPLNRNAQVASSSGNSVNTPRIEQTAYQWTAASESASNPLRPAEQSVLQVQGFTMPQTPAPVLPQSDVMPQNPPSLQSQPVLPPAPVPATNIPNTGIQPRPSATQPQLQTVPSNIYPNNAYGMNQNWDDCIATMDNSPYVSAPVRYISSQPCGCGPFMQTGYTTVQPQPYAPPPAVIAQPVLTPDVVPPGYYANDVGFKPLLSLGQERYNVVLGRGIIGQPTAYVPGQTFRNILRYLSP